MMTAMEFQSPYFPPPFSGSGVQANSQDFISHNISNDPYQQYAVSCYSNHISRFKIIISKHLKKRFSDNCIMYIVK